MEQFIGIVLPLLAGFMIGYILWRAHQKSPDAVKELEWDDFRRTMRKGQLVDIRKKEKAEKDKIKGARVFSPGRLKSKYQTKVPKDQAVYLYCDNGRKSKRVAKTLARKGFKEIYVLKGGLEATKTHGTKKHGTR
ncbi:MAG: rhodanese-like domain-containing protein [Candidatus Izemoplasmataceae bacterium]